MLALSFVPGLHIERVRITHAKEWVLQIMFETCMVTNTLEEPGSAKLRFNHEDIRDAKLQATT